jgi:hypothetical protein
MGYPRVINMMCVKYSSQELETGKGETSRKLGSRSHLVLK